LPIYGLPETLDMVRRVIDAFQLEEHAVPVTWQPLEAGATIPLTSVPQANEQWQIRTAMTTHARPCLALRIEDAPSGRAIVHSADTAPSPEVTALAQGAHTLIHEASTSAPSTLHTTPRQAGDVAREAGAQRLVLVHYSPQWTMPEEQALAAISESGFAGQAEIGREFQVLDLPDPA
jgi:ribonuclease Z